MVNNENKPNTSLIPTVLLGLTLYPQKKAQIKERITKKNLVCPYSDDFTLINGELTNVGIRPKKATTE